MVLVPESRRGEIDARRFLVARLGFGVFDRPTRITVLLFCRSGERFKEPKLLIAA
jgi:hypothetical protein